MLQSCPTLCDTIDGSPSGFPSLNNLTPTRLISYAPLVILLVPSLLGLMFSPRDTAQRQQTEMLSFPERDLFAYLSSCSPRGQSSNLTHISRDQEGWWHHLHTLSLPHSRFLVSLGKEHMFGGPVFMAATQGTSLESLALVASRTYIHGSYRTATVFNHLLPSALAED